MISSQSLSPAALTDSQKRHQRHPDTLLADFNRIRTESVSICQPLEIEDYGIQTMPDVSPPKWHLAHTSWFFETFLLKPFAARFEPFHPQFEHLFNSYYNGVGEPYPRPRRGLLSRPTVDEIYAYRDWVDEGLERLLEAADPGVMPEIASRLELGINHEQQHQELILTDLKYNLGNNPLHPEYRSNLTPPAAVRAVGPLRFVEFPGGCVEVGASAAARFCFDNELPRHRVLLQPYALASRLVTNGEYLQFIADGGYGASELWLSDGWSWLRDELVTAPLYWRDAGRAEYRLGGLHALDPDSPVVHVSFYEADAYARWAGHRLATEHEWEHAAQAQSCVGNFASSDWLHPAPATGAQGPIDQLFGDVWEWTASPYVAYPRYQALAGTLGEYNGKFMSNQLSLRGGSCATPEGHVRASYRNFFYPGDRWQFSGIRLASDA